MLRIRPAAVLLMTIIAMLSRHVPMHAQDENAYALISMERIRTALEQQSPYLQWLIPSSDTPTFYLDIHQPFLLSPPPQNTFDPTYGLPSIGALMIDGIVKIRSTAVNYKHDLATRRAKREVERALKAFCEINNCLTNLETIVAR
jgi:hypothetical protein